MQRGPYNQKLKKAYKNITYTSESALLSRMNWWTVEYGLIGDINNYKIYGAGLLSSVEESENCISDNIKKEGIKPLLFLSNYSYKGISDICFIISIVCYTMPSCSSVHRAHISICFDIMISFKFR